MFKLTDTTTNLARIYVYDFGMNIFSINGGTLTVDDAVYFSNNGNDRVSE